ncbi:MAG: class B sortase [Hespellia sp.]|nr:class B sortase [Hespellia sp.]
MKNERNKRYHRGRRKKKKNLISNLILIIAIIVFLFSAVMLIKSLLPYVQGKAGYKKIQDVAIKQEKDNDTPTAFSVDFDELLKLNPDTVGWIRFDEPSIINYPIVQGEDNSQYLTQSFTEDDNKLGTIFVNIYNHGDFTDRETVVYGHNMHYGGDMFTKMIEYESEDFCKQYPYFYIYTPDGKVSTYQVFAAEYVQDDSEIYSVDFADDAAFLNRINLIRASALYQTDVEITAQNQIVVLSTCTDFAKDQRFLLNGVKIKEEAVSAE